MKIFFQNFFLSPSHIWKLFSSLVSDYFSKLLEEGNKSYAGKTTEIIINLSRIENIGFTIFVEDKNTAAERTILSNYQGNVHFNLISN